jgi:hypothetical protein
VYTNLDSLYIKAPEVILARVALVVDPIIEGEVLVELDHDLVTVDLGYYAGSGDAQAFAVPIPDGYLADPDLDGALPIN